MAAGLGFKDFVTGEVLTAADVDGYLMQGVWVFASAAARDAAVTSPQEGNFAYLKDTNVTTYYTGSAWANLDTTGMTNPMTTTGDTIYSSSGSTPARLGIGSTGDVLTVAAGVPSWAAPASGGGMTLLNSGGTSLTGASINFGTISGSYNNLQLVIRNYLPATDNQDLYLRFNGDSGTNYIEKDTMASSGNQAYSISSAVLSNGSDNGVGNGLVIVDVYDYANATTLKRYDTRAITNNPTTTANLNLRMGFGVFNSTSAITGIALAPSSGNFTSGTAFLYGVK
jgi:hypothetical protein